MNVAIARHLDDPDRRAEIAVGAARTQRDHTYSIRIVELARVCGLQKSTPFRSLFESR